jgi:membrane protein implicated in regulation of membrane protease activity
LLEAIHWAATALGIVGALFVALRRPIVGFIIWIPSNALWVAWSVSVRDAATGLTFAVYLAVTLLGLWRWGGARRYRPGGQSPG